MQEWGLELPKDQSIPQATAAKYRDFLIATASGEGVLRMNKVSAYTIAAIAPFMRLYLHLFHIILTKLDDTSHVYKKWLQEIKVSLIYTYVWLIIYLFRKIITYFMFLHYEITGISSGN